MREFSNNTNARLPVLFLLDASSSMNGIVRGDNQHIVRQEYADGINWNIVTGDNMVTRMDELNSGLRSGDHIRPDGGDGEGVRSDPGI